MQCFARWEKDDASGVFFRDQTILQFGNNWDLLASFILLNPGSALPLNHESKTEYLRSKKLPYFVEPKAGESYLEFSIDRLMRDVLKLFSTVPRRFVWNLTARIHRSGARWGLWATRQSELSTNPPGGAFC